jgi:hypothetical protein
MRVAILQSNYIPWRGYFDIISKVDLFIFYDDVQYTKNDWRNRNKIKTPRGAEWLTVPVGPKLNRRICDVTIPDARWQQRHYRRLEASYRSAPYFEAMKDFLESVYLHTIWTNLSELNQTLIKRICAEHLDIRTPFEDSRRYSLAASKGERVVELLSKAGATEYLSGPAAKAYLDPKLLELAGISLEWMDYADYPEYEQLYPPFDGAVSILDMLLTLGPETRYYMRAGRNFGRGATAHSLG